MITTIIRISKIKFVKIEYFKKMTLKKNHLNLIWRKKKYRNFKNGNQNPNMNSIVLFLVDIYLSLSRSVDQSLIFFILKLCLVIPTSKIHCED